MRILIGVPTFDHKIDADCFKAIYGLDRLGHTVHFDFIKGYDCARARSMLALEAINYNYDYLLMVDADMVLSSNTIQGLLAVHEYIAFGWYHRRQMNTDNTETFIWRDGEKNFGEHNVVKVKDMPGELFRVRGSGLGCALIHTDVFRTIPRPWFEFVDYNRSLEDDRNNTLSEDTYFCVKADAAGYKMYCNPMVRAFHITETWL